MKEAGERPPLCGANREWRAPSPAGVLELTINGTKPEKDPRAIAAAARSGGGDDNRCVLCWAAAEHAGCDGRIGTGGPVRTVALDGEEWGWWFSPYGYFPEHLIVSAPRHRPMAIDHKTVRRLLDFSDAFPQWFIGSNADLPIVGGSILSHDHFQGGGHRFPLMGRPLRRSFALRGAAPVQAGVVDWPASVVRLRTADRTALDEAADRVLDTWRSFSFEPCGIRARSASVPHNTVNPILWREGDDYVLDIVLRNNRTTAEHPFGLFHVPEELFPIKKENIGLIEIMGRAILPGRLAADFPGNQEACSRAFYEILQATGVFKDDEAGRAGWDAFIGALN